MTKHNDRTTQIEQWLRARPGQAIHVSEITRHAFPDEVADEGEKVIRDRVSTCAARLSKVDDNVVRVRRGTYKYVPPTASAHVDAVVTGPTPDVDPMGPGALLEVIATTDGTDGVGVRLIVRDVEGQITIWQQA